MASLPQKFKSLLAPTFVEREIQGNIFRFYTVSVSAATRLAPAISRMIGHLSVLIGGNPEADQGRTLKDYEAPSGEKVQETVVEPINPALAKLRLEQRKAAMEGAVEALLDPKTRMVLGELLMDSLRDDFARNARRDTALVGEFVDSMDVPTLLEFVKGLAEANIGVFGDLGKGLRRALQARADELLAKANAVSEPAQPEESATAG